MPKHRLPKTEYSVAFEQPGADELSLSAGYDLIRSRCDVGGQRLVAAWYMTGRGFIPVPLKALCVFCDGS